MHRVTALSIVLTLAVGPNTALLCKQWCDPQAAATVCHLDGPAASESIGGEADCDTVVLGPAAILQENAKPEASSSEWEHAIPVLRYHPIPPTADAGPHREPGRKGPFDARPLPTALRI